MQAQIAEIRKILVIEDQKWQGVRDTAKLFPETQPPQPERPEQPEQAPESNSAAGEQSPRRGRRKSLSDYPPKLRVLFDEQSRRVWRTQELTQTLIERRVLDGPEREESNRVTRALMVLQDEDYIEKVTKGQYRRKTPLTDYQSAAHLGFPAPERLPTEDGP
jgi:hypothetical protein